MEIVFADSRQYAYTLRRTTNPKDVKMSDYFEHMSNLCAKTNSSQIEHVFEQKGGLHMHGIIEVPDEANMKLFRVRGWHMYMEELYNIAGWRFYMLKEQMVQADNEKRRKDLQESIFPSQALIVLGTQNTEEKHNSPRRE